MSLKHALLGFLNYGGITGYQLKKIFDHSVSDFWSASLSQIYVTLNKMCEDKLVTAKEIESSSAMNKKMYYITDKGKKELVAWLKQPAKIEKTRIEFLVKLYFSSNINTKEAIVQLEELIGVLKMRLQHYKKWVKHIEKEHLLKENMKKEALFWRLTCSYGIMVRENSIEWCEECIEEIKKFNLEGLKNE